VTRKKDVSTLRLADGAIAGPIRDPKSDDAVVAIAAAVAVAVEVLSKVCCCIEILEHYICSDQMAGEWTVWWNDRARKQRTHRLDPAAPFAASKSNSWERAVLAQGA